MAKKAKAPRDDLQQPDALPINTKRRWNLVNRPKRLRLWTDAAMLGAMKEVTNGLMGINHAAAEYNVPRTTLKDRIAGCVVHSTSIGKKPYLTYEEERELVDFLVTCSNAGYGKTRSDVLRIVGSTVMKKGIKKDIKISDGWWCRFLKRWPQLRLCKGDPFPLVRKEATNVQVFEKYFELLEESLIKYGLKDKPAQIYNCDESGMPLEHKIAKVIVIKGAKKVRQVSSGNKTQITILGCVSAAGQTIPPMVVFS